VIFGLALTLPHFGKIPTAKLLSGVFAGLAFCFLGARLESLLPRRYLFTVVVFLYSFVQILWIFEDIQSVFTPAEVYLSAFFGKTLVGLLVLNYYPEIANSAKSFYEFKRAHIEA
jgi:hypothetical protein